MNVTIQTGTGLYELIGQGGGDMTAMVETSTFSALKTQGDDGVVALMIDGSENEALAEAVRSSGINCRLVNAAACEESIIPQLIIADYKGNFLSSVRLQWKDVPLILITDTLPEHLADTRAIDFIQRPINRVELEHRIKFVMGFIRQLNVARAERQALQQEIEAKNRELFLQLELLIHSGTVKDKILEGIGRIQPFLNHEGKAKLQTLLKQFRWELQDEATINFSRAFDDLNSPLYKRLQSICPRITRGEKRLCAFIIKDHSSSDIARITRKSQNSINVAFSRLRSKLGLTNSKNLKSFLETIGSDSNPERFSFTRAMMSTASGNVLATGFDTLQSA